MPCNPLGTKRSRKEEEVDDDDDVARAVNEEMGGEPAADAEPVTRKDIYEPTWETRLKHEKTHIPFRPWCRACVAARKPDWAHRDLGGTRAKRLMPEVHMDYCFFRDATSEPSVPTIIIKDRESLAIAAHVTPYKGGDSEWTIRQACRDLKRWGIRGDLTIRCDQENALIDLANEVGRQRQENRSVRTLLEHNSVGDSKANGFIESGVKTIEGLVRTIKFGLEEHIQKKISAHHPIFAWIVEHAADLQTKFQVGVDGMTPYQRLKGKPFQGEILEFGCRIHHRVPGKTKGGLLEWRWLEGVWLGSRFETREHIVGMDDGRVVRTRSVQAFPMESRWCADKVLNIVGMPWTPTGTVRKVTVDPASVPTPSVQHQGGEEAQPVQRGMPVQLKHVKKFGYTEGCRKCKTIREGDLSQPTLGHSDTCRARMGGLAKEDDEFKAQAEAGEKRKMDTKGPQQQQQQGPEEAEEPPAKRMTPTIDGPEQEPEGTGESSSSGRGPVGEEGQARAEQVEEQEKLQESDGEGGDIPIPIVDEDPEENDQALKRRWREDEEAEPRRTARRLSLPRDQDYERHLKDSENLSLSFVLKDLKNHFTKYEVCEIFSPPRTCQRARELGRKGGWSLDIKVEDPITRQKWDLSDKRVVARVKEMIRKDSPQLLVASPPCTLFSQLQNLSGGPEPVALQKAIVLFEVAVDLCMYQARLGGRFVLEHPKSSRAWKRSCRAWPRCSRPRNW